MKATVKFSLEIEVSIETEKDINDTTVLELNLKASNLGNSLYDVLHNMKTAELLNEKINKDYKAHIVNVNQVKERKIII
jgi:hypothetical protein